MNYNDVLQKARACIDTAKCKACPVCNGLACRNTIPGPGAKGVGDTAIRNYQKWQNIRVQMDTLHENKPVDMSVQLFGRKFSYPFFAGPVGAIGENKPVDMSVQLFGRKFSYPFFAGPVGAIGLHYGNAYDELTYNKILVSACAENGIAAFTGDGLDEKVIISACEAIDAAGGAGIPTVKPWNLPLVEEKFQLVKKSGAFAVAMDVDAAGLPFLKNMQPPAGSKSVEELAEIVKAAGIPFIVKGVMTVRGALKAHAAGAAAIIVSNHGGRVLDQCSATAEVLEEICHAVGGDMKVLVDGGIRSGVDIFKALALGADGVVIARPFGCRKHCRYFA